MKYPDEFYYEETESSIRHTYTPTGNLDVSQLIHNKPYWIDPTPRGKKQKKLVVLDWLVAAYSDERKSMVNDLIRQLKKDGFQICDSSDKSLTKDNSLSLDHYWMNRLFNLFDPDVPPNTYILILSEFSALSPANQYKLIKTIQECGHPLTHIIVDIYSKRANLDTKVISDCFPQAKKYERYIKFMPYHEISTAALIELIKRMPDLKILDLDDIDVLHDSNEKIEFPKNHIEELILGDTVCKNFHFLDQLLNNCHNIKKITIVYTDPSNVLMNLNYRHLEELHLNFIENINPTLISHVRKRAARLRILDISGSTISGMTPDKPPIKSNTTSSVDANTNLDKNAKHTCRKIFSAIDTSEKIPVNHYRLQVFNTVKINKNCSIHNAFELMNDSDDLQLRSIHNFTRSNYPIDTLLSHLPSSTKHYRGKQKIILTNEWQAIASVTNTKMTHFSIDDPSVDVEIQISLRDHLYYIRSKELSPATEKEILLDFIIEIIHQPTVSLPDDIENKIKQCLAFKSEPLIMPSGEHTGEDYLAALEKQETGACRHRVLIFKAWMSRHHPEIPTRIIINDCHAFVEVFYKHQWISCELGGYPAELNIIEPAIEEKSQPEHTISARLLPTANISESNVSCYEKLLRDLETPPPKTKPLLEYMQECVKPDAVKKRLIKLNSTDQVDAMHYALLAHCKNTHKPIFYIHSPDDLICSSPFIKREGNRGIMQRGPGGALHDFLTAKYDPFNPPIIVINYHNFKADDMVRLNAIIDQDRKADGTEVPKEALIIGLINTNKPGCYQGADFYARFDTRDTYQIPLDQMNIPTIPTSETTTTTQSIPVINLFHTAQWENKLLGQWVLNNDTLEYVEGELITALLQGHTTIEIQNGLWNNESFQRFWREATLRGYIETAGQRINLPKNFKIIKSEGYNRQKLDACLTKTDELQPASFILNPSLLSRFFSQYHFNKDTESLVHVPGLIESSKNSILPVYVTRDISEDDWAMLLTECQKYNVKLHAYFTPEVIDISQWNGDIANTQIITSTDMDTTAAMLTKNKKTKWQVIDVSECTPADLLERLTGKFNEGTLKFEFNQLSCALLSGLAENKHIILTGKCSPELADHLAPLIIERQLSNDTQGQLVLVTNQPELFKYARCVSHNVAEYEKKQYAIKLPDNAWDGMRSLQSTIPQLADFNPATSADEARLFTQQRLASIHEKLNDQPYVFISGLSGVGKSTFIQKELEKDGNQLFIGEDKIKEWASNNDQGIKYLFIDEANLSPRDWSEFEGLFHQPPGILIEGQYYLLSPEHKVIFAGNPLSYGDERRLATLFQRHGNALVFDPLPTAVLFEEIVKPIFDKTHFESNAGNLSHCFLNVYRFLATCSTTEVLITPRELEMMALLTLSHCEKYPDDPDKTARYYAYCIAKNLVPTNYRAEFDNQFKVTSLISSSITEHLNHYLVTDSRLSILQQLHELLDLRDLRRNNLARNDKQQYGGLGGIIIEGEPGIGKTELVINTILNHHSTKDKPFYHIPISLSIKEKESLLLNAFHEGAIVVIDEINSSPMMERLLNTLLMGKTPEGKRPDKPGFMMIGTQNPVTMAGRRAASTALSRRLITEVLKPYPTNEIAYILTKKGLPEAQAIELATASHNLSPTPTLRDVLRVAEYPIKENKPIQSQSLMTRYVNSTLNLFKRWQTKPANQPTPAKPSNP